MRKYDARGHCSFIPPGVIASLANSDTMMIEQNQRFVQIIDEEIIPNMNEIDSTRIIWQNYHEINDDFCSLNTCKKKIGDEKAIYIRELKTGLIAFFHPNCFKEIKK